MKKETVPYKRMVFVCTNVRDDADRPSCGLRGSPELCDALKDEVKKRGLKGKVRALKSGCMDLCEKGPIIMTFPENTVYANVTKDDLPTLFKEVFP